MSWRVATVRAVRDETARARTIRFEVPGWPGHDAGQHIDLRLTAPDGYTAVRSYSIASAPDGDRVELTVERIDDGEVSPYLTSVLEPGDRIELRGPLGGWFVWRPAQTEHVQLIAGGSGLVPLMAMVRAHAQAKSLAPLRLLYSVRDPDVVLYRNELLERERKGLALSVVHTRRAPPGAQRPAQRVDAGVLAALTWRPEEGATTYVCGPTGFVEAVADLLVAAGHEARHIRTERFGPSGGT